MGFNNVKVKETVLEIEGTGKIKIDLGEIEKLVELNKGCSFTSQGVLDFCRSFKKNKEIYPMPVYTSDSVRDLHMVFTSSVPNSYDYAVLAHILLAQGRIKSKIVSVAKPKNDSGNDQRAFVIFVENEKIFVLDSGVNTTVELENNKPYTKKGVGYTEVKGNYKMVSVEDVPNYAPEIEPGLS